MVINLATLSGDRTPVSADISPAALDVPAEDFTLERPAHFEGEIQRLSGDTFQLTGQLQAQLSLPCARCAEPFAYPVDAQVELKFVPATGPQEAAVASNDDEDDGREMSAEDPALVPYDEPVIDLTHVVREQCYLALPMKPLCKPDCKGLCPQCGTNLNVATCNCDPRWEDPRLAGLKALLKDADPNGPRE